MCPEQITTRVCDPTSLLRPTSLIFSPICSFFFLFSATLFLSSWVSGSLSAVILHWSPNLGLTLFLGPSSSYFREIVALFLTCSNLRRFDLSSQIGYQVSKLLCRMDPLNPRQNISDAILRPQIIGSKSTQTDEIHLPVSFLSEPDPEDNTSNA